MHVGNAERYRRLLAVLIDKVGRLDDERIERAYLALRNAYRTGRARRVDYLERRVVVDRGKVEAVAVVAVLVVHERGKRYRELVAVFELDVVLVFVVDVAIRHVKPVVLVVVYGLGCRLGREHRYIDDKLFGVVLIVDKREAILRVGHDARRLDGDAHRLRIVAVGAALSAEHVPRFNREVVDIARVGEHAYGNARIVLHKAQRARRVVVADYKAAETARRPVVRISRAAARRIHNVELELALERLRVIHGIRVHLVIDVVLCALEFVGRSESALPVVVKLVLIVFCSEQRKAVARLHDDIERFRAAVSVGMDLGRGVGIAYDEHYRLLRSDGVGKLEAHTHGVLERAVGREYQRRRVGRCVDRDGNGTFGRAVYGDVPRRYVVRGHVARHRRHDEIVFDKREVIGSRHAARLIRVYLFVRTRGRYDVLPLSVRLDYGHVVRALGLGNHVVVGQKTRDVDGVFILRSRRSAVTDAERVKSVAYLFARTVERRFKLLDAVRKCELVVNDIDLDRRGIPHGVREPHIAEVVEAYDPVRIVDTAVIFRAVAVEVGLEVVSLEIRVFIRIAHA